MCMIGRAGLTLARKTSGHVGQESDTLSSSLAPLPHTPSFFICRVGIVVLHAGLSRVHIEMCISGCFIHHLGLQTLKEPCLPVEGILSLCSRYDPIDPTDLGGAQISLLGMLLDLFSRQEQQVGKATGRELCLGLTKHCAVAMSYRRFTGYPGMHASHTQDLISFSHASVG